MRHAVAFCTVCGTPIAESATAELRADAALPSQAKLGLPASPLRRLVIGAILILIAVALGVGIAKILPSRSNAKTSSPDSNEVGGVEISRASDAATTSTSTPTVTTTTIGVSTEVPSEPAPIDLTALTPVRGDPVDPVTGRSASELAHDVAVVFETLNVEAEGYPALEELVTPELLAKLEPMGMIEPYHGNGCWQIVTSINLVQMASEYQLFAFDLEPEMRCPDSNAEDPYGILPPGSQGMVRVEVAISSDPNGRLIVTGVRQA